MEKSQAESSREGGREGVRRREQIHRKRNDKRRIPEPSPQMGRQEKLEKKGKNNK